MKTKYNHSSFYKMLPIDAEFQIKLARENILLAEEIRQKYPRQITNSMANTIKYDDVRTIGFDRPLFSDAIITVDNDDVVDAAFRLQRAGHNPLVLNMASDRYPGGGWRKGWFGQEESLFYRSTYFLALENQRWYPLRPYNCIYSPDVFFFRTNQTDGYELLPYEECCFLSCVAMPALRKPDLVDGKLSARDHEITVEKVRGIFKVALRHRHDSVVLSALGCGGAYANPPEEIANIFKMVSNEYKNYLRQIVIAIVDYGSNHYELFRNVFSS